jgi:uncharacterized protein (DUF488 family)
MTRTLFTIGHSTHSLEYFLSLLAKHRIEVVCDVRSVPYSQHNPQFNREPLKAQLRTTSTAYVFLGKELGARSDNPGCYIDGKVQYNYLVDEPPFQEGLRRLRNGVERFRVALMCAERDPLTCHRTILVCRELREPGLNIQHILADGGIESNDAAEKRLMSMMKMTPDMLVNERDCIERAYEVQASNIAYVIPAQNSDSSGHRLPDENLHDRLHQ